MSGKFCLRVFKPYSIKYRTITPSLIGALMSFSSTTSLSVSWSRKKVIEANLEMSSKSQSASSMSFCLKVSAVIFLLFFKLFFKIFVLSCNKRFFRFFWFFRCDGTAHEHISQTIVGVVLPVRVNILNPHLIVNERRNRPLYVVARLKRLEPGFSVRSQCQHPSELRQTIQPVVIPFKHLYSRVSHDFGNRLPAFQGFRSFAEIGLVPH